MNAANNVAVHTIPTAEQAATLKARGVRKFDRLVTELGLEDAMYCLEADDINNYLYADLDPASVVCVMKGVMESMCKYLKAAQEA